MSLSYTLIRDISYLEPDQVRMIPISRFKYEKESCLDLKICFNRSMFLQVAFYTFTFWLGVYLIARDLSSVRLRWAGLGLVAYAIALGLDLLALQANEPTKDLLLQLHWAVMVLPPLFWTGAVIGLMPEEDERKSWLIKVWQRVLVPLVLVTSLLFALGLIVWESDNPSFSGYLVFGLISLFPLVALLFLLPHLKQAGSTRRAFGLVVIGTVFFGLGAGMVLLGSGWLPHSWIVIAIGMDIVLLGLAVVYFDAFEQGETIGNDFLRSFAIAILVILVFGGQVLFVITISTGPTLTMLALQLAILTTAILLAGFAGEIQRLLDNLVFARLPRLRQERTELLGVARALPKASQDPEPKIMGEKAFYKATRRALSHFNTLPKLAINPLTALPEVTQQLEARGAPDNTLERAHELRYLLAESIERNPTQRKPSEPRMPGAITMHYIFHTWLVYAPTAGAQNMIAATR